MTRGYVVPDELANAAVDAARLILEDRGSDDATKLRAARLLLAMMRADFEVTRAD